ncbi:MAG: hypothetical protein IT380_11045 [Myxococcales bacterium]|nr:hypothetical protein [Myxococcales bacterium]
MERKGGSTAVVTAETVAVALTKTATTAAEEQVLRMRYGAALDHDTPLPQAHGGNEELEDELLVIEMALLRALKRRAAESKAKAKAAAPKSATKSKIVSALKGKKKS